MNFKQFINITNQCRSFIYWYAGFLIPSKHSKSVILDFGLKILVKPIEIKR